VDGDPGQLVTQYLALSGVQPGAHLDPQLGGLANNCLGTSNSPCRSVKGSKESIARSIDLATTIALELTTDDSVMTLEEFSPIAIAETRHEFGRSGDVGAEDRC
jgi:hypothetical protein